MARCEAGEAAGCRSGGKVSPDAAAGDGGSAPRRAPSGDGLFLLTIGALTAAEIAVLAAWLVGCL